MAGSETSLCSLQVGRVTVQTQRWPQCARRLGSQCLTVKDSLRSSWSTLSDTPPGLVGGELLIKRYPCKSAVTTAESASPFCCSSLLRALQANS